MLRLDTPEFHPSHTKETSSNSLPSSEPKSLLQLPIPWYLSAFWLRLSSGSSPQVGGSPRLSDCGTITTACPAGPRDPHSANRWPRLHVAEPQASLHPLSWMGSVQEPNQLSHVVLPASWTGADGVLVNITSGLRGCVLPKSTSAVSEWEP